MQQCVELLAVAGGKCCVKRAGWKNAASAGFVSTPWRTKISDAVVMVFWVRGSDAAAYLKPSRLFGGFRDAGVDQCPRSIFVGNLIEIGVHPGRAG